jgi:hypothetical protein
MIIEPEKTRLVMNRLKFIVNELLTWEFDKVAVARLVARESGISLKHVYRLLNSYKHVRLYTKTYDALIIFIYKYNRDEILN